MSKLLSSAIIDGGTFYDGKWKFMLINRIYHSLVGECASVQHIKLPEAYTL